MVCLAWFDQLPGMAACAAGAGGAGVLLHRIVPLSNSGKFRRRQAEEPSSQLLQNTFGNNNLELTHQDSRRQRKIDPHGVLAAAFWLGGFGLPSAVASQLPVAVTSEFLVLDGIERLVFVGLIVKISEPARSGPRPSGAVGRL